VEFKEIFARKFIDEILPWLAGVVVLGTAIHCAQSNVCRTASPSVKKSPADLYGSLVERGKIDQSFVVNILLAVCDYVTAMIDQ